MKIIREEVDITPYVERGLVGVNVDAARDNINIHLTGSLEKCFITPYVALERVAKVLANFHIFIPKLTFLEGEHGVEVIPVKQFGELMGMRDNGEVVTKIENPYSIYFEYAQNESGMFDVFCEIVNQEELDELLQDMKSDVEEAGAEEDREERLDEQTFMSHMPRDYVNMFPGVKEDPQKAAQYRLARRRKADVAQHYDARFASLNEEGPKGTYRRGMSSPRPIDVAKTAETADKALDKAYGYGTSGRISPIAGIRKKQGFGAAANYNSAEQGIRAASRSNNLRTVSNAVHKGWGKTVDQLPAPKPEKQAARKKLQQTAYSELPKGEQEKDDVISKSIMKVQNKRK